MSLILSARYVHSPRWGYRCSECGRLLGPHIYLYGRAHETEPPGALRLCVAHISDPNPDPKVQAALDEAKRRAPEAAAEAERLAAWNGVSARDQS